MINYQTFFALALTASIGGIAGYIGSLMLTKRIALMGGALGHLTMPGIALAIVYNIDVSIGALVFVLLGIIIIWLLEQKTNLPTEALTAVVFASSLAITFLFLPKEETIPALIGDISHISLPVTVTTMLLSCVLFFVLKKKFSGLVLIGISEDVAHSLNLSVKKYNLIFLVSIAIIVALGVRIVGGLMTAALLAIPACASRNVSKNLFQYAYGAMLLGALSGVLGTMIFLLTELPIGPLIILVSSTLFALSIIIKKIIPRG